LVKLEKGKSVGMEGSRERKKTYGPERRGAVDFSGFEPKI
jgi:hypothetical protein